MEVYYLDNGEYPVTTSSHTHGDEKWAELEAVLGVTLPRDPLGEIGDPGVAPFPHNYSYRAWGNPSWCNRQNYAIVYNKENSIETGVGFNRCAQNAGQVFDWGDAYVTTAPL